MDTQAGHEDLTVLDNKDRTPCEIWSRCMGYHRPVEYWNPGKQQEHKDRVYFKEPAVGIKPN